MGKETKEGGQALSVGVARVSLARVLSYYQRAGNLDEPAKLQDN
jgi:ABC-type transport system involved in cytochrome bd biosynthesis fused ATPase/permease subunit